MTPSLEHYGKPYNYVVKVNDKPFLRFDFPPETLKLLTKKPISKNCKFMNENKKEFFKESIAETKTAKQDKGNQNIKPPTSNNLKGDK